MEIIVDFGSKEKASEFVKELPNATKPNRLGQVVIRNPNNIVITSVVRQGGNFNVIKQ